MSQLKRNAFYNTAYQVIRIIFPIITYPYVSRILGPEGIGKVSYAQTFAEYFTTFSMLGLPIYAVREISRGRAYPGQLEQTTGELLSLSICLSLGAFILYGGSVFLLPHVTPEPLLHWIFAIMVLFSWAKIDWFFQGIENYRYIALRNLLLRIVSISLIFLVIKSKEHYILYGAIWALSTVISSFWNLWYCYHLTHPRWNLGSWKQHLRKSLPSAFLSFSMFLYATIDTIMLGVMLTDDKYSVGIYNVAGRIVRIVMTIVGGVNAVLTPRLAYIDETGNKERMGQIIRKSIAFTLYFTIPASLGLFIVADDLILLFAGPKFQPSIVTMRILSFELVILGIGSIFEQLLYATKKEKQLLTINLIALTLAVVSNWLTIPAFRQDGAAAATVFTRIVQTGLLLASAITLVSHMADVRTYIRIGIANVIMGALTLSIKSACSSFLTGYRLTTTVLGAMVFYILVSWILRIEPFLIVKDWVLQKMLPAKNHY